MSELRRDRVPELHIALDELSFEDFGDPTSGQSHDEWLTGCVRLSCFDLERRILPRDLRCFGSQRVK